MHELTIAYRIFESLQQTAASHDLVRIDKVVLQVGIMQQIESEALTQAFAVVSCGSLAEGAELEICEMPIELACRHCDRTYAGRIDCYRCPDCGRADPEILSGNQLVIATIEGEPATGANTS